MSSLIGTASEYDKSKTEFADAILEYNASKFKALFRPGVKDGTWESKTIHDANTKQVERNRASKEVAESIHSIHDFQGFEIVTQVIDVLGTPTIQIILSNVIAMGLAQRH